MGILRRRVLFKPTFIPLVFANAEAEAYYDLSVALSETLTSTAAMAIDSFVTSIKNAGYWYSLDRLWLFPPNAPTLASYDLISILGSQHQYTYVGSYTYDEIGWLGDSSTGYIDTNYNPNVNYINLDTGNCLFNMYSQVDLSVYGTVEMFGAIEGANAIHISQKYGSMSSGVWDYNGTSGSAFSQIFKGTSISCSVTDGSTCLITNDADVVSFGINQNSPPDYNVFIGAMNDNGAGALDFLPGYVSHFAIGGEFTYIDAFSYNAYSITLQQNIIPGGREAF